MSVPRLRRAAEEISAVLRSHGFVALLAGGCVRDLLLGREPKDYDIATDATPEDIVSIFHRSERVGARFGVVIVRRRGCMIEVATFREDGGYSDGRHPDSVRFASQEEDARRRDFTINGMFLDPTDGGVIDYVGGRTDLQAKVVRAIGDPRQRFAEDHLRMLRAVRFAAALGFDLDRDTLAAIRRAAKRITDISVERIMQELQRILTGSAPSRGWELLADTGLLPHVLPEVDRSPDALRATAERLATLSPETGIAAALALVFRRFEPNAAAAVCRRLRCSQHIEKSVAWLVEQLPRVRNAAALELADIKLLMADPRFAPLAALLGADARADGDCSAHEQLLARAAAIPAESIAPPPLLTGADLRAMGVPEGPVYGKVLGEVCRAQLNETLPDRAAALALARELLNE